MTCTNNYILIHIQAKLNTMKLKPGLGAFYAIRIRPIHQLPGPARDKHVMTHDRSLWRQRRRLDNICCLTQLRRSRLTEDVVVYVDNLTSVTSRYHGSTTQQWVYTLLWCHKHSMTCTMVRLHSAPWIQHGVHTKPGIPDMRSYRLISSRRLNKDASRWQTVNTMLSDWLEFPRRYRKFPSADIFGRRHCGAIAKLWVKMMHSQAARW